MKFRFQCIKERETHIQTQIIVRLIQLIKSDIGDREIRVCEFLLICRDQLWNERDSKREKERERDKRKEITLNLIIKCTKPNSKI